MTRDDGVAAAARDAGGAGAMKERRPARAAPVAEADPGSDDAGARWPARLEVQACLDERGTRVQNAHVGPLRLLKTLYPEGPGIAHAVLVHPPGGLVGGDRLDVELDVGRGAHLLVTQPAATRFYRSVAGVAAQSMSARVASGARLEWLPQETLAYDGCEALNAWHVRLEGSASLLAMEVLALGLGAAGKPFASGHFLQRLHIEGLWREHGVIDARDSALLDGPCGLAGRRVLGTLVLAAGEPLPPAVAEAALEAARAAIGEETGGTVGDAQAGRGAGVARLGEGDPGGAIEGGKAAARDENAEGAVAARPLLAGATLLHGRLLVLRVLADEVEPAMRLLRRVRTRWRAQAWALQGPEPRLWAL